MSALSPEEAALWRKVTDTIRPLSRERPAQAIATAASPASPPTAVRAPKGRVPPPRPAAPLPPLPTARRHGQLDGHWDRRLRKGEVEPDRTLDLHGYTLDRAWDAIDQLLERALASGDRVVLLITGHRREGAPPVERGKIRAAVHHWLDASRHADRIAAVRGAHRRHGGGGSLYVILRR